MATWFDEQKMCGDINTQMADGIDATSSLVVCITERYMTKVAGKGVNGADDNCKFEVRTALDIARRTAAST